MIMFYYKKLGWVRIWFFEGNLMKDPVSYLPPPLPSQTLWYKKCRSKGSEKKILF